MSNNPQSALQGCVRSLQASMQLMESSLDVLDAGMNDFPRLTKVLQATRVRSKHNTIRINMLINNGILN